MVAPPRDPTSLPCQGDLLLKIAPTTTNRGSLVRPLI